MSEVELLAFQEDPRSPLYEASKEEQKEFPAICRLSGRRVSCILLAEKDPSLPRCIPASTVFAVGSIEDVNRQISTAPLLPCSSLAPLVSESDVRARSLSAPCAGMSIVGVLKQRRESVLNVDKGRKSTSIERAKYPGFRMLGPTPLPGWVEAVEVLQRVTRAQHVFSSKPRLCQAWVQWFHSEVSVDLFLDCFWWFFLDRFHQGREDQECSKVALFDRMAESYVTLLSRPDLGNHRESVFKLHPDAMAQAVYCAFIQCFPISWRQFDAEFKSHLCNTLSLWLVGARPMQGGWQRWNYRALDPPKELMLITTEKEKETAHERRFDLDALLAGPVPPAKSKVTLQLPRGQPDTSSKQLHAPSSSGLVGLASSDSLLKHSQKRPSSLHCIATPSEPSGPPPVATVLHKLESNESMHPAPSHTSLSSCSKEAGGGKEEEEVGVNATGAAAKKYLGSSTTGWRPLPRAVVRDTPLESYAAGEKPKFGHVLFNVHGRSPLVQHYLLRRGLGHDSGWSLLLQRTEVVSVPPREAETYRDVLRSSGKVLRRIEKDFDRHYAEQRRRILQFEQERCDQKQQYRRNVGVVLGHKKDVSRLSQYLTLQLLSGDQHKPMKSRQRAISEYLASELEHMGCS